MEQPRPPSIWWFALGYFLCYAPYSGLTKALTSGGLSPRALDGFEVLPISVLASTVAMFVFITAMGWWRHARRDPFLGLPSPGRWTFLSGLCTAAIIVTTTLAYTLSGISIVFMMLLMRGGVLVLAPVVDRLSGRRVRWFSGVALALSLGALVAAFSEDGGTALTSLALADVAVYLASYFIRLRLMSRLAKSDRREQSLRYFVEEQMVAAPTVLVLLLVGAAVGHGETLAALRRGFVGLEPAAMGWAALIGLLSQGTGIFGGLILLAREENTFCVPVNRASSILAGVLASAGLWSFGGEPLSAHQLVGAALILAAIGFLAVPVLRPGSRGALET